MCGAKVLTHPALVADLHGIVCIAVNVGHRGGAGAGLSVSTTGSSSSETHLLTISCANTVGGVGTDIVGGVGLQIGKYTGELACAKAIARVAALHGRVIRGAPAYTAGGHCCAAVGSHIAAAGG